MKPKFHSDDNLPLKKMIEIPIVTIILRAVFHKNNIFIPKFFLMNVYIKYKNVML